MPQKITTGFRALIDAAEREIETLTPEDAIALHGRNDTVFVDLRDPRELEREGRMPGAFHCPRGMLEFWIDPDSPYHKPIFAENKRFVFFCAGGWRSALAGQTAAGRPHQGRLRRLAQGQRPGRSATGQAEIQLRRLPQNPHETVAHFLLRFLDVSLQRSEVRQVGGARQ
jgi:rhodanese-related sulfurtransferase